MTQLVRRIERDKHTGVTRMFMAVMFSADTWFVSPVIAEAAEPVARTVRAAPSLSTICGLVIGAAALSVCSMIALLWMLIIRPSKSR